MAREHQGIREEAQLCRTNSGEEARPSQVNLGESSSDSEVITTNIYEVPMEGAEWHCPVSVKNVQDLRRKCQIPNSVLLRVPSNEDRASAASNPDGVCMHVKSIVAGVRFPLPHEAREVLSYL